MEGAPECFGKRPEQCRICPFAESCLYVLNENLKRGKRKTLEYNDAIAVKKDAPPVDISEKRSYSQDEMIAVVSYLLRMGKSKEYQKILEMNPTGHYKSMTEIARERGVSRQAIHKALAKIMQRMFGFKERTMKESGLLNLTELELRLYKLRVLGFTDPESQEILELNDKDMKALQEGLDQRIDVRQARSRRVAIPILLYDRLTVLGKGDMKLQTAGYSTLFYRILDEAGRQQVLDIWYHHRGIRSMTSVKKINHEMLSEGEANSIADWLRHHYPRKKLKKA